MLFEVESPGGSLGQDAWFARSLIDGAVVGSLPRFSEWWLPPLYQSGVVWRLAEAHGTGVEPLLPPPLVNQQGHGDCGDLTLWRLCELNLDRWAPIVRRVKGRSQMVGLRWVKPPYRAVVEWSGPEMHAYIRCPDGSFEDPSRELGMPG